MNICPTDTHRLIAMALVALTVSLSACNTDKDRHIQDPPTAEPAPPDDEAPAPPEDEEPLPPDDEDTTPTLPSEEEQNTSSIEASRQGVEITFTSPDTHVNRVTGHLGLPDYDPANEVNISWHSSHPALIAHNGTVTRPPFDYPPAEVTLTAVFSKGAQQATREFQVIVARESAYFVKDEKMYRTDGTFDGTEQATWVPLAGLIPEPPQDNGYLPTLGDTVLFAVRERHHASLGRIPSVYGGELWGYNTANHDFSAINIGPDSDGSVISGVPSSLVWEYAGDAEHRRIRFHALDVAPGSNLKDGYIPCSDVQIWETDGIWRGIPRTLSATKIDGCPEPNPADIVIVNTLNEGQQVTLQNLVSDVILYEESKILVNYNPYGNHPITSGTLAMAILDFGDYLRPHIESQILELGTLIDNPPENAGAAMQLQFQRSRAALQEALDKYIGEDKHNSDKQEFAQRMSSSGAHLAFMGEGKDIDALTSQFSDQEIADLEMRMALMAPLISALKMAVLNGEALSISQRNIAARVANRINEKRQFLSEALTRLELEYITEKEKVGASNPWALKTMPDIAMSAEQIAVNRLTAAAIGTGAGGATGAALVLGIKLGGGVIFPFAKAGSAALLTSAGGASAVIGVAVGVWVIGAVSVAMLIEEAENKAAFENARARSAVSVHADLSNLAMDDGGYGQADYFSGFTAMYTEIR